MRAARVNIEVRPGTSQLRVAIVHDALVNTGGAERVVTFMCEAFPDAPVYTSVYLPKNTYKEFASRAVHVLPCARWAHSERAMKLLLPLWLRGFRHLDFSNYDVVLSSTTFAAKFVRPAPHIPHACYLHGPFRLLWRPEVYESSSVPFGRVAKKAIDLARPALQKWDRAATNRLSAIATNCGNMVRAIRECYHRDAEIIYAPVRLADYRIGAGVGDYYLTVSRLISWKRVELAVKAARQLRRRLVVVGDGPELANLRAIADDHVTFVGQIVDRERLAALFCSHEDFGLAPIEAQASGRPVIAYRAGGALETVTDGVSGIFFNEQTTESVVDAILRFEGASFDPNRIRASVERFDVEPFKRGLRDFVMRAANGGATANEN